MLGPAWKAVSAVRSVDLSECNLGSAGVTALCAELALNASITRVDVRNNNIAGDGASQLSAAVLGNTTIEVFNEVPIKEMRADSFTTLNLEDKRIGIVGAMVVASLLPAMASITLVDLKYNDLSEEGKAVLRKAVEGRSGCELLL